VATAYDVVTLGETMIRLSPPVAQRLEQASVLEINVGGAESNVAVALARLGFKVAWLSRLPDNAQGVARSEAYPVEIVDRLGAGDAFDAGFLAARLWGRPLAECLRYGAALSALCMTIPSDLALVTAEEVEALLAQGETQIQR